MSNWQKLGQALVVLLLIVGGFAIVNRLPNPAWETPRLADAAVEISVGLEKNWDDRYLGRLAASDVEKLGLAPDAWRRSGNGWRIGQGGEVFEVGTWKAAQSNGFAFIYSGMSQQQCEDLSRLLGDAFDQIQVNKSGQSCSKDQNVVVFYRNLN